MKHLVRAIPLNGDDRYTIDDGYRLVKEARDYLAQRGAKAIEQAWGAKPHGTWGTDLKRVRVDLTGSNRPKLITHEVEEHNLVEVINQCATMERLLEAFGRAKEELRGHEVERCHPTTSSFPQDVDDHDLVLVSNGNKAKFEISDVASSKDGNGKEKKDLLSLGVLPKATEQAESKDARPEGRLFLVVSEEFAQWLLRPSRRSPRCYRYVEAKNEGLTRVLEVVRG